MFTDVGRYAKTVLLIAKVSPYEQPGGGAGSIYVIGDSTGYGTGASASEDSVVGRLGNAYTWYRIQNDSKNGRKIAGAVDALGSISEKQDVLILQIGANDLLAGTSVDTVVAEMKHLIELSRDKADQVVVITAGNIGAAPAFVDTNSASALTEASREYDAKLIALAHQYQNVAFVSLFDEPQDDPFVTNASELMSMDGLHPSSAGYQVWYEKSLPYFETILEAK